MAAEYHEMSAQRLGKILISACLVGQKVRYDGGHQRLIHPLITAWEQAGWLVPCCPEVLGGLPTPRPPAEINGGAGKDVVQGTASVKTAVGDDVTTAFVSGAQAALELAKASEIRLAILCQRSPSCGSRQIYNGRFEGVLISGAGVTTALLSDHGISVFGPEEIEAVAELLHA
jgi:uncharacterized protein YbbK (DUF523 family)